MRYEVPLKLRRNVRFDAPPPSRLSALMHHGVEVDEESPDYEPCWVWTGSTNNAGYGQVKFNAKNWNLHRLAWHMLVERLPQPGRARDADGLVLDHVCENRLCLNPSHLEKVSQSVNVKRGARHRD